MEFRVSDGPFRVGPRTRLVLTKKQADRRRSMLQRVGGDGELIVITPRLRAPRPALPNVGEYEVLKAIELKSGEVFGVPDGVDPVATFGKAALLKLAPEDESAVRSMAPKPKAPARTGDHLNVTPRPVNVSDGLPGDVPNDHHEKIREAVKSLPDEDFGPNRRPLLGPLSKVVGFKVTREALSEALGQEE